ncbi:MAG TPA: nucleotidyltransferase family protein [Phycisphaerae bacterium]|nr:nucleotidyltransferase family protein [Phycisphaerae bacterium]
MTVAELIHDQRAEFLRLAERRGAYNVRVFGSVARGEDDESSDVDFLVDMESGRSLLDLGGLLMDLQDLLGRKVDVMTEPALHWYIRGRILGEAVPL